MPLQQVDTALYSGSKREGNEFEWQKSIPQGETDGIVDQLDTTEQAT
jgi:hypothetical protein